MDHMYADIDHWATAHLVKVGDHNVYMLTGIEVNREYRGQGHGSALLKRVCAAADAEGAGLILGVDPDGTGLNFKALQDWYGRHGFVADSADDTFMSRRARGGSNDARPDEAWNNVPSSVLDSLSPSGQGYGDGGSLRQEERLQ